MALDPKGCQELVVTGVYVRKGFKQHVGDVNLLHPTSRLHRSIPIQDGWFMDQ